VVEVLADKSVVGKTFKQNAKLITDYFAKLTPDEVVQIEEKIKAAGANGEIELKIQDQDFKIKTEILQVKRYQKTVHVEEIVPSVIEPSFGIGRIMYSIWEHNFLIRDGDEKRTYLALPAVIAPYKCSVLPLSNNESFAPLIKKLSHLLTSKGVSHKVDDSSAAIGKRYARTDEIAIPYAITIDFDSVASGSSSENTVTLRERNSMQQIRINVSAVADLLAELADMKNTWEEVTKDYPSFVEQQTITKDNWFQTTSSSSSQ